MVAVVAVGFMSSCSSDLTKVTPQGSIVLKNRDVPPSFTSLSVEDGIEVILSQSSNDSKVMVETYANVQDFVDVLSSNRNGLVIGVRKGTSFKGDPHIRVRITVNDLQLISLSGGSRATIAPKLEGHNMVFDLSGGSNLSGEVISQNSLSINLSGGSQITLNGSTETYNVTCSGGSKVNGFDFLCQTVSTDLSGGSQLNIAVEREIKIKLSGGSRIVYKAPQDVRLTLGEISGGSDLIRAE